MSAVGYEEVVVFWPWTDDEQAVFEREVPQVMALAG